MADSQKKGGEGLMSSELLMIHRKECIFIWLNCSRDVFENQDRPSCINYVLFFKSALRLVLSMCSKMIAFHLASMRNCACSILGMM